MSRRWYGGSSELGRRPRRGAGGARPAAAALAASYPSWRPRRGRGGRWRSRPPALGGRPRRQCGGHGRADGRVAGLLPRRPPPLLLPPAKRASAWVPYPTPARRRPSCGIDRGRRRRWPVGVATPAPGATPRPVAPHDGGPHSLRPSPPLLHFPPLSHRPPSPTPQTCGPQDVSRVEGGTPTPRRTVHGGHGGVVRGGRGCVVRGGRPRAVADSVSWP